VVVENPPTPESRPAPVVAIAMGQSPDALSADMCLEGPIPPSRLREGVGRVSGEVQPAPDWRLYGLDGLPWGADRTGRWVVELAREIDGGRIVVDVRDYPADRGRRLAAQIERWRRLRGAGVAGSERTSGG
jgi:hypothetical protein